MAFRAPVLCSHMITNNFVYCTLIVRQCDMPLWFIGLHGGAGEFPLSMGAAMRSVGPPFLPLHLWVFGKFGGDAPQRIGATLLALCMWHQSRCHHTDVLSIHLHAPCQGGLAPIAEQLMSSGADAVPPDVHARGTGDVYSIFPTWSRLSTRLVSFWGFSAYHFLIRWYDMDAAIG